MWYMHIMEYYSAIKGNNIGSFVEMWTELEAVRQSEVSQKNKYSMLTHNMWNPFKESFADPKVTYTLCFL